ncbi:chromate transporter [Tissierella sp. Yu-01]|uniref:chromate transporter n=1 Tax=Tissierella sp. Yu-01 TaxID=3035694 RepID=UPI00240E8E80|nr:chromate transporter [Tissierella sp. Yu-01]WFA08680.1 chromate transporter [Tissierella sp. Yu-01]
MLWKMFITFFKIGAFTFGGGYAMIPIIQEEVVEKKKWIEDAEFMDAIALAQASPGPVAVNTSVYCGYKLRGVIGAIVCTLGTVLPSFFTILFIAIFFYQFKDNDIVSQIFMGIRPAVVALILSAVYKMWKKSKFSYDKLVVVIGTILIIVLFDISPIWMVIAGGLGSFLINKIRE